MDDEVPNPKFLVTAHDRATDELLFYNTMRTVSLSELVRKE
jgi:hypothetical protein